MNMIFVEFLKFW